MSLFSVRRVVGTFLFAAAISFSSNPAFAVDVNARIKGTVTDPSGAVIPGAAVIATNVATGVKYSTKSTSNGSYFFAQLPIGTYSINIVAPGFKSFTATGIILTIDQEYVEPAKLALGDASETLEVAADPVQVNTTDMQLDNIVTSAQMVELPLIGRGFTALEQISPGVQASSDRFGSYSANGGQTQQSSYLIDGADTNDLALNTVTFSPNLDAIDQFNLITGPLNAEYDRNSGGIVSATIKVGTNHFHGDAFEFYRDTFLNTANYFNTVVPATGAPYKNVTPYHQNIYGGTIGGPILRDKLFFFGAYQGTHQRVPGTGGTTNVFSTAELGGDFTTSVLGTNPQGSTISYTNANPIPGTITSLASYNALCAPGDAWGPCLQALGGKIPTAAFNPIAANLVKTFVPAANSGTNSYVFNSVAATKANQYIGKLSYAPTSKDQIAFLGIYSKSNATENIPFTGATIPGFGEIDSTTIQQYTASYIHQFSAILVNDFAAHYTRFNYQAVTPQNVVQPSTFGFSITPENAAAASLPTIATGYFTLGFSTNGPQPRIDQVYQLDDTISLSLGHHQFKFGYDGRKYNVSNPFYANNSGSYGYSASASFGTGNPGLDFLLGNPNSYAQGSGAEIQAQAFLNYLFVQDTWRVADNFTFDYGLGYQIDTPLHNLQYGGEAVTCFIPGEQSVVFANAPVGVVYPGDKGCSNSSQAYTRFGDLGPRIGFAWTPDLGILSAGNSHKFSVRGGFGIYYNRTEEETSLNNLQTPPFGLGSQGAVDYGAAAPAFANPYQDVDTGTIYKNKFPYVFPTKGQTIDYSLFEPLDLNSYASNFRSPYAENFQLSLERELPGRFIARASYVGSLAHHNQITFEGNPETAAGHAACLAATTTCGAANSTGNTYRTYQSYYFTKNTAYGFVDPATGIPAIPSVGMVGSEGASSYHALQLSVDKGLTHGLQLQASYTYSHALDDGSSYENSGYGSSGRGYNQFNHSLNYGNSSYDARQRFVFAPVYIVPTFHGSAFSPVNLALSGWEISGISTFATGFPFDISYAGGSANSAWCSPGFSFYACPDEPNQTGALVRAANPRAKAVSAAGVVQNYTTWFTQANFAQAPIGSFGNTSRDEYHGPGINNTNMILAKNFNLNAEGSRRLQIRMESDNVFNHTQFSNPASSVSSSNSGVLNYGSAGRITSAAASRLTQLAAKFYF